MREQKLLSGLFLFALQVASATNDNMVMVIYTFKRIFVNAVVVDSIVVCCSVDFYNVAVVMSIH